METKCQNLSFKQEFGISFMFWCLKSKYQQMLLKSGNGTSNGDQKMLSLIVYLLFPAGISISCLCLKTNIGEQNIEQTKPIPEHKKTREKYIDLSK